MPKLDFAADVFQPALTEIEEKTYFVHATLSFPKTGRLIAGGQELYTSPQIYSKLRQTLHFAIGSVIPKAISSGDRTTYPYALIAPFESLKPQLAEVSFLDSYIIGDLSCDNTMFLLVPKDQVLSEEIIKSNINIVTYDPSIETISEISKKVIQTQQGWTTQLQHRDFEVYAPVFIEKGDEKALVDNFNFFNPLLENYKQLSIGGNDVNFIKGNPDSKLLPILTRYLSDLKSDLFTSGVMGESRVIIDYLFGSLTDYLSNYFPSSSVLTIVESEKNKLYTILDYCLERGEHIFSRDKSLQYDLINAAISKSNLIDHLKGQKGIYFRPLRQVQDKLIDTLPRGFPFTRILNFINYCRDAGFTVKQSAVNQYFISQEIVQYSYSNQPLQENALYFSIHQLLRDQFLYYFKNPFMFSESVLYNALSLPSKKFWELLNLPEVGFIFESRGSVIPTSHEEVNNFRRQLLEKDKFSFLSTSEIEYHILFDVNKRFISLVDKEKINFLNQITENLIKKSKTGMSSFITNDGVQAVIKLRDKILSVLFDYNQSVNEVITFFFAENPVYKQAIIDDRGYRLTRLFKKETSWYDIINQSAPNVFESSLLMSRREGKSNPYPQPANFEEAVNYYFDSRRSLLIRQQFYKNKVLESFKDLNAEQVHLQLLKLARVLASLDSDLEVESINQTQQLLDQVIASFDSEKLEIQNRLSLDKNYQSVDLLEKKANEKIHNLLSKRCAATPCKKKMESSQRQTQIQALTKTQSLYQHLANVVKKVFAKQANDLMFAAVNQWQVLNLFEQPVLRGRCLGFTKAFSESVRQTKQGAYLDTLHELMQLKDRLERGYRLSMDEQAQLRSLNQALMSLEQEGLNDSDWEKIHDIDSIELKKKTVPQSLIMAMQGAETKGDDYAIHLTIGSVDHAPQHQVGIVRSDNQYHYFDSNAGYVCNIKDPSKFFTFLKTILPKSYGWKTARRVRFELHRMKNKTSRPSYEPLFGFLSEKQRLAMQDQTSVLLHFGNALVDRVTLYDWQLGYLDEAGKLVSSIDSKYALTAESLINGLQEKRLGLDKLSYLKRVTSLFAQAQKKSFTQLLVSELRIAQAFLPFVKGGLKKENYLAIDSALKRFLATDFTEIPDLKIERGLDRIVPNRIFKFEKHLIELSFKRSLLKKTESELIKNAKLSSSPTDATAGLNALVLSKSLFDMGKIIAQGNTEQALLNAAFLSYALLISPRLERWVIENSETLFNQLALSGNFFKGVQSPINSANQIGKVTKKVKWLSRGLGGVAGNLLDVSDLALGIKQLIEAKYGSRAWQDGVFETSLAITSLIGGIGLVVTAAGGPAGAAFALLIIGTSGIYYGVKNHEEYQVYGLTSEEAMVVFGHGFLGLEVPDDIKYLQARSDMVNQLARSGSKLLQTLPDHFVGYGAGMGEYVLNKQWYLQQFNRSYHQKALNYPVDNIMPGISIINRVVPAQDYASHLSRIIPTKPDAELSYYCLPSFRMESIETQGDPFLSGTVKGIYSVSNTVRCECENAFMFINKTREKAAQENQLESTILLDLKLVRSGQANGFNNYAMVFKLYGSDSNFEINGSADRKNQFMINDPLFAGSVFGGQKGSNLLYLPLMPDPLQQLYSYQAFVSLTSSAANDSQIRFYGTENESVLFSAHAMQMVVGEEGQAEIISCKLNEQGLNADVWVQSQGGFSERLVSEHPQNYNFVLSSLKLVRANVGHIYTQTAEGVVFPKTLASPRNWDVIEYCEKVILAGFSHYRASLNRWGNLLINVKTATPGEVRITPAYSADEMFEGQPTDIKEQLQTINARLSMQTINFLDAKLLADMDFYYQPEINSLILKKIFFQIELQHFFNFAENRSNYKLINLEQSWVQPVLDNRLIIWWKQNKLIEVSLRQFSLSHYLNNAGIFNLSKAESYAEANQKGQKPIQILSKVIANNVQAEFKSYFGSSGEDVLFLDANYVQGGRGSDNYVLSLAKDYLVIDNYAEKNATTEHFEIDQLLVLEKAGVSLPYQWKIAQPESTTSGITIKFPLSQTLQPIHVHLSLYLSAMPYQHIVIRYVRHDSSESMWIPLRLNEQQLVLVPYYSKQPQIVHWLSSVQSVSPIVVIEARKSEIFRWLRNEKDLIMERHDKQKWVLDDYYIDSLRWKGFKLCITEQASLVSMDQEDNVHCFGEESFQQNALLAIDVNDIFLEVRQQQIKRYPLHLNHSELLGEQNSKPVALSSNYPIQYLEIPSHLVLSKICVQPADVNSENLQLTLLTATKNYTVLIKNKLLPEVELRLIHYRNLIINLAQNEPIDQFEMQKSLDINLLRQHIEDYLDTLSAEPRRELTLAQLASLFYLDSSQINDFIDYFFIVEKGLDLFADELQIYLDWIMSSPQNGFNQINSCLEKAEVVKNLLYLAMKAATQEQFSKAKLDQCFAIFSLGLRNNLWAKVNEPFSADESAVQRLEKLKSWLDDNLNDVMDSIRNERSHWDLNNTSLPAFIDQINQLNDLHKAKDSHYTLEKNSVMTKLIQKSVSAPLSANANRIFSTSSWLSWLVGSLSTIGSFALGYTVWTSRRRLGFARARAASLSLGGTVYRFDQAQATKNVKLMETSLGLNLIQSSGTENSESKVSKVGFGAEQLSENFFSLARLAAEKLTDKRNKQYLKKDFARRACISQAEDQQVKFELDYLINSFMKSATASLEQKPINASMDLVTKKLAKRLLCQPFKAYLNASLTYTDLTDKISECLQAEFSDLEMQINLREVVYDLLFKKVYQSIKNKPFSSIEELAEQQKTAMLSIMPILSQHQEDFFDKSATYNFFKYDSGQASEHCKSNRHSNIPRAIGLH